jgi:hypothetical protein
MNRLAVVAAIALASCVAPTRVDVTLTLGAHAPQPDTIEMSVYDDWGAVARLAPLDGTKLPGDVMVLVSPSATRVRISAVGMNGGAVTSGQVTVATVFPGGQSDVALQLDAPPPLDSDGDGVPNAIDNCPKIPNADQSSSDGGPGDACRPTFPAASGDGGVIIGGDDGGSVAMHRCGDGTVDPGEECDDGPNNSDQPSDNAACTTACTRRARCGDTAGSDGAALDQQSGHCYISWSTPLSFEPARRECQRRGGDLVAVNSAAENTIVNLLGVNNQAWIGLTVDPGSTSFYWVTGEPLTFNGFGPGQPNDGPGQEACVRLDFDGWHDIPCGFPSSGLLPQAPNVQHAYICETACGNGKIDPGEECDDDGPDCTPTCRSVRSCNEPGGVVSPVNGHCYFATNNTVDYQTGLGECPPDAHPATLDEIAETEAGEQAIGSTGDAWIPLSSNNNVGDYSWDVGPTVFDPRRYHGFFGNEPNNNTLPVCARITPQGWDDGPCGSWHNVLCERE